MINRHQIWVAATVDRVVPEIIRWGQASWWPQRSLMRFSRDDQGPVRVGTVYRQKVMLPFGPCWEARVTVLEKDKITRQFFNGMFEGEETVSAAGQKDRTQISYEMTYEVKGIANKIVWRLISQKMHDQNLRLILDHLKTYLEQKVRPS